MSCISAITTFRRREKGVCLVKRGRRYVETFAGKVVIFVGGEDWGRFVGLCFFLFYVCVCVCCLSLKKLVCCFFCKQKVLREF